MVHGSRFHERQNFNGSSSDSNRVFKNKGILGHMSHVTVTTQNLEVVEVDVENSLTLVRGVISGSRKALVMLHETMESEK